MSTLFINGKPAYMNSLGKLENTPSWLVILPVVSFKKVSVFLKDLFTSMRSFISLFVRVILNSQLMTFF